MGFLLHTLPVKNQADILYYSGHGHSASGELECHDSGGKFTVSEVDPAANWREDLDYFIIAGCSVLRPDATNGFAWGNATLKQGILRGLCGYHDRAPNDTTQGSDQIAARFAQLMISQMPPNHTSTGDRCLNAWLQANLEKRAGAIVYNDTCYWLVQPAPGPFEYIDGPFVW